MFLCTQNINQTCVINEIDWTLQNVWCSPKMSHFNRYDIYICAVIKCLLRSFVRILDILQPYSIVSGCGYVVKSFFISFRVVCLEFQAMLLIQYHSINPYDGSIHISNIDKNSSTLQILHHKTQHFLWIN